MYRLERGRPFRSATLHSRMLLALEIKFAEKKQVKIGTEPDRIVYVCVLCAVRALLIGVMHC